MHEVVRAHPGVVLGGSGRAGIAVAAVLIACCGGEMNDEETARLERPQPEVGGAVGSGLEGSRWTLVTLEMGDGESMTPGASDVVVLDFAEEVLPTGARSLTGSGGCNPFAAQYEATEDGRIRVADAEFEIGQTCRETVRRLELVLEMALEGATSYELVDDQLSIMFGGGTLRLRSEGSPPTS